MALLEYIKSRFHDEDGAVTVDWVVLTAALVALGIAVAAAIQNGSLTAITNMWAAAEGLGH